MVFTTLTVFVTFFFRHLLFYQSASVAWPASVARPARRLRCHHLCCHCGLRCRCFNNFYNLSPPLLSPPPAPSLLPPSPPLLSPGPPFFSPFLQLGISAPAGRPTFLSLCDDVAVCVPTFLLHTSITVSSQLVRKATKDSRPKLDKKRIKTSRSMSVSFFLICF